MTPLSTHLASRGAPLDPTGPSGRTLLRRELVHPAYHRSDVTQQIYDYLQRQLSRGLDATSQTPLLATVVAVVVAVALLTGLALLISRVRGSARTKGGADRAVLGAERISAAALRARAEAALADGRPGDAVADGFRALAVRQVERGRLEDSPGATAYEVGVVLAREYPQRRDQVADSARLFEAVRYGERPATPEQARVVLGLDDELAVSR